MTPQRSAATRVFSEAKKAWAAGLTFIVAWAGAVGVLDPATMTVNLDVDLTLGQMIAALVGLILNVGGVYGVTNRSNEPEETNDVEAPSS